jgi:hypothetical protein
VIISSLSYTTWQRPVLCCLPLGTSGDCTIKVYREKDEAIVVIIIIIIIIIIDENSVGETFKLFLNALRRRRSKKMDTKQQVFFDGITRSKWHCSSDSQRRRRFFCLELMVKL